MPAVCGEHAHGHKISPRTQGTSETAAAGMTSSAVVPWNGSPRGVKNTGSPGNSTGAVSSAGDTLALSSLSSLSVPKIETFQLTSRSLVMSPAVTSRRCNRQQQQVQGHCHVRARSDTIHVCVRVSPDITNALVPIHAGPV